jgi:hypothetical protein
MKGYVLVLMGIAVGCAAGAAGLGPAVSVGGVEQAGAARPVEQYCTDTGDFNNTEALNGLVQKAGSQGWELVAVARAEAVGVSKADYVCFRRAR